MHVCRGKREATKKGRAWEGRPPSLPFRMTNTQLIDGEYFAPRNVGGEPRATTPAIMPSKAMHARMHGEEGQQNVTLRRRDALRAFLNPAPGKMAKRDWISHPTSLAWW